MDSLDQGHSREIEHLKNNYTQELTNLQTEQVETSKSIAVRTQNSRSGER
jgi:hypothetical protein